MPMYLGVNSLELNRVYFCGDMHKTGVEDYSLIPTQPLEKIQVSGEMSK